MIMQYRIEKKLSKNGTVKFYSQHKQAWWPFWFNVFGGGYDSTNSWELTLTKAQQKLDEHIIGIYNKTVAKKEVIGYEPDKSLYDKALVVINEIKKNRAKALIYKEDNNPIIQEYAKAVLLGIERPEGYERDETK